MYGTIRFLPRLPAALRLPLSPPDTNKKNTRRWSQMRAPRNPPCPPHPFQGHRGKVTNVVVALLFSNVSNPLEKIIERIANCLMSYKKIWCCPRPPLPVLMHFFFIDCNINVEQFFSYDVFMQKSLVSFFYFLEADSLSSCISSSILQLGLMNAPSLMSSL